MYVPQAFLLDGDSMLHIMKEYPVVEERLWRVSGIRTAIQLLPHLPEYQVHYLYSSTNHVCVCVCVRVCLECTVLYVYMCVQV